MNTIGLINKNIELLKIKLRVLLKQRKIHYKTVKYNYIITDIYNTIDQIRHLENHLK